LLRGSTFHDYRLGLIGGEPRPYLVDNVPRRRHQAKNNHRAAIDDRFAIHEHLVLTIVPADRVHLYPQLTPEACRRTDGMES